MGLGRRWEGGRKVYDAETLAESICLGGRGSEFLVTITIIVCVYMLGGMCFKYR